MAQDTAGETAAGPFYDAAKATYTQLLDPRHSVSALFGLVNVPTAIMIDEDGRIVRRDEGAYTRKYSAGTLEFGTDEYLPALRDWVEKGAASTYAQQLSEVVHSLPRLTPTQALADAHFRLGAYLQERGEEEEAREHWHEAQRLHPESWNYHRQEWSYTPADAGRKWFEKFRGLDGKPYYAPMSLPKAPEPD